MSYSIRYGRELRQEQQLKKRKTVQNLWFISAVLMLLAVVFIPELRELLGGILLPQWDAETVAAFSGMITRISEGQAVPAAIIRFCEDVFRNAGIAV